MMYDEEKMKTYNEGILEGMKHTGSSAATLEKFVDVNKEILELKTEWGTFKSRALSILLAGVVGAAGYGVWIGTLQQVVTTNERNIASNGVAIDNFDERIQANDITSAEVRAKLANIESTLAEIKLAIKNVR
jgi:hypothetical protein